MKRRDRNKLRREERQEEALHRQATYEILPVQERIDGLDKKFGKDMDACKERAKLNKLL